MSRPAIHNHVRLMCKSQSTVLPVDFHSSAAQNRWWHCGIDPFDAHRTQEAVALNKRLKLAGAASVSCQATRAVSKGIKCRPDGRVQVQDLLHWQATHGGVDVGPASTVSQCTGCGCS